MMSHTRRLITTLTSAAFGSLVWIFPVLHLAPFRTAHILVLAGITVGSAVLVILAALWLERVCRVKDDDQPRDAEDDDSR